MVRTYSRSLLVFSVITGLVAISIAVLSALNYAGPLWVLVGFPALPAVAILSGIFPGMGDLGAYIASACLYGALGAVWFLPLRGRWQVAACGAAIVYVAIVALFAVSAFAAMGMGSGV